MNDQNGKRFSPSCVRIGRVDISATGFSWVRRHEGLCIYTHSSTVRNTDSLPCLHSHLYPHTKVKVWLEFDLNSWGLILQNLQSVQYEHNSECSQYLSHTQISVVRVNIVGRIRSENIHNCTLLTANPQGSSCLIAVQVEVADTVWQACSSDSGSESDCLECLSLPGPALSPRTCQKI